MTENAEPEVEMVAGGEIAARASDPEAMRFTEDSGEPPVLEGRMMPYDEWTEVDSSIEGHFMERFAPGSLTKTMNERASRIRALFEHGLSFLGKQPIAQIEEMRDEQDGAYFRAALLEGLPPLLISGLRRSLYGASIRFRPIKMERVRSPKASDHNPDRLPEHTIREASIMEFSVVTFPQYAGATAHVRSITDELAAQKLFEDPAKLIRMLDARQAEPQHSQETKPPAEGTSSGRSRSTQPPHRDYLHPKEERPSWLLKTE